MNEEVAFTHTSFHLFTSLMLSRTRIMIFSRVGFFHGKEVRNLDNFKEELFFTGTKNINLIKFHGKSLLHFSSTFVSIFTYAI